MLPIPKQQAFSLTEKPKITFGEGSMSIASASGTQNFELDKVQNLSFTRQGGSAIQALTDPNASILLFPNPVKNTPLEVELYLPREATIRVQLRNASGLIIMNENKGAQPVGICQFQLPAYSLPMDNYILSIWLDEKLIEGIILKR